MLQKLVEYLDSHEFTQTGEEGFYIADVLPKPRDFKRQKGRRSAHDWSHHCIGLRSHLFTLEALGYVRSQLIGNNMLYHLLPGAYYFLQARLKIVDPRK